MADQPARPKRRYRKQNASTDPTEQPTGRTTITLPGFQLFELRSLTGIYGPNLTQVVEWIVGDWLASNQQNIEIRRRRHLEYLESQRSDTE